MENPPQQPSSVFRNEAHIVHTPIDIAHWHSLAVDDESGAVSSFAGYTRKSNGNFTVTSLFYEAYEEMALAQMQEIHSRAREQFSGLRHLVTVHRLGLVSLRAASIFIAVSAPRRRTSLAACEWMIDEFKANVTIWKKECTEDGSELWIGNDSVLPV